MPKLGVQEVAHFTSALCLFGYRCRGLCLVLHAARSISFVRFGTGGDNANSGCMYGVIAMSAHVQIISCSHHGC